MTDWETKSCCFSKQCSQQQSSRHRLSTTSQGRPAIKGTDRSWRTDLKRFKTATSSMIKQSRKILLQRPLHSLLKAKIWSLKRGIAPNRRRRKTRTIRKMSGTSDLVASKRSEELWSCIRLTRLRGVLLRGTDPVQRSKHTIFKLDLDLEYIQAQSVQRTPLLWVQSHPNWTLASNTLLKT